MKELQLEVHSSLQVLKVIHNHQCPELGEYSLAQQVLCKSVWFQRVVHSWV